MQRRSESLATVVNSLLVMLLPLAVLVAGSSINLNNFDASVTADVPGAPRMWATIRILVPASLVLLPFALIALRLLLMTLPFALAAHSQASFH